MESPLSRSSVVTENYSESNSSSTFDPVNNIDQEHTATQIYNQIIREHSFLGCDNIEESVKPILIKKISQAIFKWQSETMTKMDAHLTKESSNTSFDLNFSQIIKDALVEAFGQKQAEVNLYEQKASLSKRNTTIAAFANLATAIIVGTVTLTYHFLTQPDCSQS